MMSSNNSTRSRHSYGVLAQVKISELKKVNVSIKRRDIINPQHQLQVDILREIDDPRAVVPLVHIKKDHIPQRWTSIFDRDDVLANQIDISPIPKNVHERPSQPSSLSNSPCSAHCSRRKSTSRSRSSSRRRRRTTTTTTTRDRGSTERRSYSPEYKNKDAKRRSKDRSFETRSFDRRSSRQRTVDRASSRRDRSCDRRKAADRRDSRERTNRSSSADRRYARRDSYSPSSRNRDSSRRRSSDKVSSRRDRRRSSSRTSRELYRSRSRGRERSRTRDYPSRRYSRERSRDRRRTADKSVSSKTVTTDAGGSRSRRSTDRGGYERRKRSITPLKPGEYRPNHPDLKRKLFDRETTDKNSAGKKIQMSTSTNRSRADSRSRRSRSRRLSTSPERYRRRSRSPRPPEISPSPRSREYERGRRRRRSRTPTTSDVPLYGDPNIDYGYYEGIPGAEFWLHPGIRPGFPVPRFYPPAFYPRGIRPVGPVIYPPRFPFIPPMIRQRLPVYNNRQKLKIMPMAAEEGDGARTVEEGTANVGTADNSRGNNEELGDAGNTADEAN